MSYSASIYCQLAADLGWDTKFFYVDDELSHDQIANNLLDYKPDLLALSLRTWERKKAVQVARIAKSLGIIVVAGGPHASGAPDDLLSTNVFDGVVLGDGAGLFEDILDSFKLLDKTKIVGRRHPDMNVYTRRLFSESQKKSIRNSGIMDVFTTLGCPFGCTYCATDRNMISLPLEKVVDEIQKAKELFDIGMIDFRDDTFTYSVKRINELQKLLKERGLKFQSKVNARTNCFSEEIATALVSLGVDDLVFGVETASPKLLLFMNKATKLPDAHRAADLCREFGLPYKINLMFGVPTQDKEDYEANLRFIERTKPDNIHTFMFFPLPGTGLFRYCQQNNHLPDDFSYENDAFYSSNLNHSMYSKAGNSLGLLKNIDYEMAYHYLLEGSKIERERIERTVFQAAEKADKGNWIVFGSGPYFTRVLEVLSVSANRWSNLQGFFSLNDYFKSREFEIQIPRIDLEKKKPKLDSVVVTVHKGYYLEKAITPLLREKFKFDGEIFSAASTGRV